jgi:hypothetical protein
MSVRQLIVIGTKPAAEPWAAVQLGSPSAAGTSNAHSGGIKPADPTKFYKQTGYSPYASRNDAEHPYFGDEHADTAWSVDVGGSGATLGPEETTRSARASTNERAETRTQDEHRRPEV